ncbi:potassium transporter [Selenomonas sp. oral taxon 126]|uniref:TrkH family potassium uptake protein n=1 Tax=Selenomonas sp. oral taxon 126 TaxID=712528 RepID=UPI0008077ECE|nr:potassium transporter TrkG [Selenomonas sp. oral taxon 126]ANR71044.1 potassium transporter [Selenomonas sp. oral taxon 126]
MRFDLFWVLMGRTAYVFAPLYLIPFAYGFAHGDSLAGSFLALGVLTAILGMVFGNMGRSHMRQLSVQEGTLFLLAVWFLLAVLGMLPFHLAGLHLSPADTFFECISALTTTGMTALGESLPPTLLLWRALMSWFGGLLFVVILVTVLPVVSGCFGVDFSVRQERLFSPLWNRMTRPMREMTLLYIAITAVAVGIYLMAGDEIFPALILALFTISSGAGPMTGGLPPTPALMLGAGLVALLSALPLLTLWQLLHRRSGAMLTRHMELRSFFLLFLAAGTILVIPPLLHGTQPFAQALGYSFFYAISFLSTNGLVLQAEIPLHSGSTLLLILLAVIGGCMGSAAGGFRISRLLVLISLAWTELLRTLHPRMVFAVRQGGEVVPLHSAGRILVLAFFFAAVFSVSSLLIALAGLSPIETITLTVACLTTTGGVASLADLDTVAALPVWTKLVCTLLMILGRIEIFAFFLLLGTLFEDTGHRW